MSCPRRATALDFHGQYITRGDHLATVEKWDGKAEIWSGSVKTAAHPQHPGVEGRATWDSNGYCPDNEALDLMKRVRPKEE